eukprot:1302982-Ditylum_brightwellii.AAC.1
MGMGMVLATADMLKNDNVRQTGETTGTNYDEAIAALKQKNVLKVLKTDKSKSWGDGILVWCNT